MAEINLINLKKKFNDNLVVRDFNLTIQDKEFLVLVGPSGCGKTTTLRMIAGLEEVSDGEIYIGGELVNHMPPMDRDIAMVFQNYALYPHMDVFNNMGFGLKNRKFSKVEIHRRVLEAATILGIDHLLDRKPKELSGGQRQRVAMGRAIVRKPKVFLFDEPLSNLDAKLRVQMRAELSKLHERLQTTIIYVTHDQVEAMTLANRIVIMKDGYIMQEGPPLKVYENPKNLSVAEFVGSPSMNLLNAEITEKNGMLYVDGRSFQLAIPSNFEKKYRELLGDKVIFGIRPEHINIHSFASDIPESAELEAAIDVIEPIGSEVILILTCGEHQLTAKIDSKIKVSLHQSIRIAIDMNKMHIFDKETKENI